MEMSGGISIIVATNVILVWLRSFLIMTLQSTLSGLTRPPEADHVPHTRPRLLTRSSRLKLKSPQRQASPSK